MGEINITPFTDVCLVLLIIFMITSTFLNAIPGLNLNLNLPDAQTPDVDTLGGLLLSIDREGQVFVNDHPTSWEGLTQVLLAEAGDDLQQLVVIQADETVAYGLVVKAMDAARLVGLTNLAMATETPPEEE